MLLIIDDDPRIRKNVCDLLKRERILGVNSITEALERIVKFRSDIKLIICRSHYLVDIETRRLVQKVCERLNIIIPPICGYYTKDEESIKGKLEQADTRSALITYDEQDEEFPQKFINLVLKLYPDVYYDIKEAQEIWNRRTEKEIGAPLDARAWLMEQGFVESSGEKAKSFDDVLPAIEDILQEDVVKEDDEEDYKTRYGEMKKKYEELAKYVQELIEFIKQFK
jgi:hypothetical protein